MSSPTSNKEPHFTASANVRDVVIGMSDGLTVPFALAAGLTGAIAASHLIVIAGLAEIAAGSISMGLGGYLAAKGDVEHYKQERKNEEWEVTEIPDREAEEVREIFEVYGLTAKQVEPILKNFRANPKLWVDFMMTNELGLEEPDPKRVLVSALTIASAYIVGGIVPLLPYFFVHNSHHALIPSVIVTLIALLLFGFFKAKIAGMNAIKSALQTVLIGGLAAGAAFVLARLIS
ncbi:MAG: VIT1/CCC1 transporter family protein [Candidatus Saccharimonadales bacterium]|jgi:predicted membrane protein (TIGR00267 family)